MGNVAVNHVVVSYLQHRPAPSCSCSSSRRRGLGPVGPFVLTRSRLACAIVFVLFQSSAVAGSRLPVRLDALSTQPAPSCSCSSSRRRGLDPVDLFVYLFVLACPCLSFSLNVLASHFRCISSSCLALPSSTLLLPYLPFPYFVSPCLSPALYVQTPLLPFPPCYLLALYIF